MYHKEVNFKINGRETSDEKLLVTIPERYADLFEGYDFGSKEHFSKALMYAGCANEAFYYDRWWLVQQNERSLRNILGIK